ncbi:MAG: branched-chain amino acid ABC transporter permease [Acidimicrobiales bacterium]
MSVSVQSARTTAVTLWQHPQTRRLFAFVMGFLVLGLMTGPSGSISTPLIGVTGSFGHPRVFVFLALGVGFWLLSLANARYRERIRAANDRVLAVPKRLFPDWRVRVVIYAALLAFAIWLPLGVNAYWQEVLVDQIGLYVLLALGLNVVVGYAGLLDLGYVAFFAIGAYSTAFWTDKLPLHPPFVLNSFWSIPFDMAAAILAGILLGAPTLRLRGDYLAIVTLGFGEIIEIVANNLNGVTGGPVGVLGIPHPDFNLFGIHYTWSIDEIPYYYILLVFVVIAVAAYHYIQESRVGRAWAAIREDEVAAESSGINVLKYKVMAFAIGAATSGMAGMLYASKVSYLEPADFTVQFSILILILVIFGGMGSIIGAALGAAFLQWVPAYERVHPTLGFQIQDLYIYFGALLIIMMIFRPQGLVPSRRRRRELELAEHGVGTADAMSAGGGPIT